VATLDTDYIIYEYGNIVATAPQLNGALTPPVLSTSRNGYYMSSTSTIAGNTYGMRCQFASSVDITSKKYFMFQGGKTQYFAFRGCLSVELGGFSILIYDSNNNYKEFYFTGNDSPLRDEGAYKNLDTNDAMSVYIDMNRTPDSVSGVLDETDVVGFEIHTRRDTSGHFNFYCGRVIGVSKRLALGSSCSFSTFDGIKTENASYNYLEFKKNEAEFWGITGDVYVPKMDFSIGDGITNTTFNDDSFYLSWYPARNDNESKNNGFINTDGGNRLFTINQSSSDTCTLTNGTISARNSNEWSLECIGSNLATASFDNLIIYRPSIITMNHLSIRNSIIDGAGSIVCSSNSTLEDSTLLNLNGRGVVLDSSSSFSNCTIKDSINAIEIENEGVFTFDGIRLIGNTNDVNVTATTGTVTINVSGGGDTPTYTTAGATVNVISGASFTIDGLVDDTEVRIQRQSDNTELYHIESVVGGSTVYAYSSSDTIKLKIIKPGYKLIVIEGIVLSGSDATYSVNMQTDLNYI
jgi:hypothetical protein